MMTKAINKQFYKNTKTVEMMQKVIKNENYYCH